VTPRRFVFQWRARAQLVASSGTQPGLKTCLAAVLEIGPALQQRTKGRLHDVRCGLARQLAFAHVAPDEVRQLGQTRHDALGERRRVIGVGSLAHQTTLTPPAGIRRALIDMIILLSDRRISPIPIPRIRRSFFSLDRRVR